MKQKTGHSQEQSTELLFASEQQGIARRRLRFKRIFVVGLSSALGTLITPFVWGRPWTTLLLFFVWFAATSFYTLGRAIPMSYGRDADIRWHVNPWRDALEHLGREDRQIQAIVLLATMPLCMILLKAFVRATQ